MAKGVRVPEKAFGIAMWVVSVILAAFIVGLGNLVIGEQAGPHLHREAHDHRDHHPAAERVVAQVPHHRL